MLRTLLLRGFLVGALAWVTGGCGDSSRGPGAGGGLDRTPIPGKCTTPAEGCPCATDLAVKCGETIERDGDRLLCRSGERSCVEGSWGECAGTKTTQIYAPAPTPPGVQVQALAPTAISCMEACDPYCQELADTPDDLNVGSDLIADPSGITLHTEGFTGGNCPDVVVDPDETTLVISAINADGTVVPDTVALEATCGASGMPVDPTWAADQPDRSMIGEDGMLRVFSGIAGDINVTASSLLDSSSSLVHVIVDINVVTGIGAPDQATFATAGTETDPGKTLYPYRNTVFPLDLKAPLVQWQTGGTAASQVQVALRYPAGAAAPTFWYSKIFAAEPTEGTLHTAGAPAWQIPQEIWSAFDRTAAGETAEIVIQRRAGATLYNEMLIPVTFADAPLRGTVYYTQYLRRLFNNDAATDLCSGQADLAATYDPLGPGSTICPVGNCTHVDTSGGSTTRAIDMSTPAAVNLDPFGGNGGCPVCHSVSANGNVYVAGSRFLATFAGGTNTGFVDSIGWNGAGQPSFTTLGEAPNYATLRTNTGDWNSRGFSYAPLTPDGALALQGFYSWGNTDDGMVANNLVLSRPRNVGGQLAPMFFVPTGNTGAQVQVATTGPLAATRSNNVLTASASGVLPSIDTVTLALNDSVLVKDQATAADNGIYTVTDLGSAAAASGNLTTATNLPSSSSAGAVQGAANAFDNNTGSRWESAFSDPQWLQVDLGSSKSIDRVRLDWETANGRTYTIRVSDDLVTWTTIVTVAGNTAGGNHRIDDHTGLNATGRYVRLDGTVRNSSNGYSIWEMDVYGASAGTPYKLTRRADADDAPGTPGAADDHGIIKAGSEVRVTRGTANYGHVFKLTAPGTDPVINTSALTYTDQNVTPLIWPMVTPTISPDGSKLAYVTGDQDTVGMDSTAWRKGLSMVDFDQTTRAVTGKKRILNNWDDMTGGNPVKWPFFESDSQSLVFVESNPATFCNTESSATDDGRACKESVYGNVAPTTRGRWPGSLYSIDTGAGTPSTTKAELAKLNDAENAADADKAYQPTVLPISIGGYRWVIFTSPRSYGNQLNQIGTHFSCGATMLWVSAVDDETATATDRSHPAFFLPGQNVVPIKTQDHYVNERGYLVKSPCKGTGLSCTTSDECCGNNCAVDTIPASGQPSKVCKASNACSAVGGACLTDDDCCGDSPCVAQQCTNVPSYTASATFERVYEAECPAGFHPLWGLFSYHLTTPGDSQLGFSAQTAETEADLATAAVVPLGDSTADNYGQAAAWVDVSDELTSDDVSPSLPWLKVSITLYPTTDGSYAPILHDWEQRFTCVPAE